MDDREVHRHAKFLFCHKWRRAMASSEEHLRYRRFLVGLTVCTIVSLLLFGLQTWRLAGARYALGVEREALKAERLERDRQREEMGKLERTLERQRSALGRRIRAAFPGAKAITGRITVVQEDVLESFEIDPANQVVHVNLLNRTHSNVRPHFRIVLLDQNGFQTDELLVVWSFFTLDPGESKTEDEPYHPRQGEPAYYCLEFF
jgi:hypothetical protein